MELTPTQIEEENKAIKAQYKELLDISYCKLSSVDRKFIRSALDTAMDAHRNQRRKSGEAYIFHPIAVAQIVASEIGLNAQGIAAALLHDVVEDSDEYSLNDIEQLFGKTVSRIVDGLTKISSLNTDGNISLQAENFRKMLLTLNEDVRVILIKLADRLHNMQTMDAMRPDKQIKIASETLYIYAPLAHRLGLYNIKTELEDLGLKYTEPDVYNDILTKIDESKEEQKNYIQLFSDRIKEVLDQQSIDCEIHGRSKSIYSIRQKMLRQNVSFEEVYDKFAIRIVYTPQDIKDEKFIAWKIYSIVTDFYRANPVRLRDWISQSKSSGYEALHITVVGPDNKWVEVQIRSQRMHEIAEKGYAAHYKYKGGADSDTDQGLDGWINRLQEALESSTTSAVDFVEEFKLNLYSKEIFVFTPQGDLKSLPKGATALDFGFSIHTQVGLQTRGARVNGKLVPLSHQLKSGDQVEIITSSKVKPTANWLNYTTTARARNKIKGALREERKLIAAEGKVILQRKLRSQKIMLNEKNVNELVRFFDLKTSQDLFYRAGIGTIDNQKIKEFASEKNNLFVNFIKNTIRKQPSPKQVHVDEVTNKYDTIVFGKDEDKLEYTLGKCCNPIGGDPIFGFVTVANGITVHKKNCPNAIQLQSNYAYRIIPANWVDSTQQEFRATLNISGIDKVGVVNQITGVLAQQYNISMCGMNLSTHHGIFEVKVTLMIKNQQILNQAIQALQKISSVDRVVRE